MHHRHDVAHDRQAQPHALLLDSLDLLEGLEHPALVFDRYAQAGIADLNNQMRGAELFTGQVQPAMQGD